MAFSKFGGMIQPVAFDSVVPAGWLRCDPDLLLISAHPDLFALLGTTYGGDGITTFGVPNLQGKAVIGAGGALTIGQEVGEASHQLITDELPPHQHILQASTASATLSDPTNNVLGHSTLSGIYRTAASDGTDLNAGTISYTGGGHAHENRQPFLAITYLIARDDVDPVYVIGELRLVPYAPPANWALCDGSLLLVSAQPDLFDVIGYTYGGSGANFALPDMRDNIPVHIGTGQGLSTYTLGQTGGDATVTLTTPQIPAHKHLFAGAAGRGRGSNTNLPIGNFVATTSGLDPIYAPPANLVSMGPDAIRVQGLGHPHNNLMPCTAFNYIIALAL